jgi:hypothetical protein
MVHLPEKYDAYGPADRQRDEAAGRKDLQALRGMEETEFSPTQREFIAEGEEDLEGYEQSHKEEAAEGSAEVTAAERRARPVEDERQNEQSKYQRRVTSLDRSRGPASDKWQRLKNKFVLAQNDYDTHQVRVGRREPERLIPPIVAIMFLVCLAFLEAAINVNAFQLFIEGMVLYSYIAAFFAGGLLMVIAHVAGRDLRSVGSTSRKRSYVFLPLRIVTIYIGCAGSGVYLLAVSRQAYLNLLAKTLTFDVHGAFQNASKAVDMVLNLFALKLEPLGWGVFALSVVLYVLGVFASSLAHDPDRQFEDSYRRFKRAQREFERFDATYQAGKNKLRVEHGVLIERLDERRTLANQHIEEARDKQRQVEARHVAAKGKIGAYVKQRIYAYEAGAWNAAAESGDPLRRNVEAAFATEKLWKSEEADGKGLRSEKSVIPFPSSNA